MLKLGKNSFDERNPFDNKEKEKGFLVKILDRMATNFEPYFLSHDWLKLKNLSAHQKENSMRLSKLTLFLILVPYLWELWPLKHCNLFKVFHATITKTHILNFTLWSINSFFSGQECPIFISRECFVISISYSFHWHHSQVWRMNTQVTGVVWTKVRLILADTVKV